VQAASIANNCLMWVQCLCVCSSNAHAWLSALTLLNRKWLIMKSDSSRLSPAEYFPLWELHQLNRESYLTISVKSLLIFHKGTG